MSDKKLQIELKIQELKKLVLKYDKAYYDNNESLVTDYEYDLLKRELLSLEEEVRVINGNENITQQKDLFGCTINNISSVNKIESPQVGYTPNSRFNKIKHKTEMLSLDNAMSEEDLGNFILKIQRFLNIQDFPELICELKIDGLSFSAMYKNGELEYIATRGDGEFGEDVTQNGKNILNFPIKLNGNYPQYLEVKGEIYLSKSNFFSLNETLEKKFSNPRNAASGTLRSIDSKVITDRKLEYFAYSIGYCTEKIETQYEILEKLKTFGFVINENYKICKTQEQVDTFYNQISKNRHTLNYDIDGLVLKVNNTELQNRLGFTTRSPRWAIAYKFSGLFGYTKIISVTHQVSKSGNITPVAELEPLNIGGVVIKRATLHNYDEISRKDLHINDIVKVERSGDVIPKIIEIDFTQRNNNSNLIKIELPKNCPSCNSVLIKDLDSDIFIRCPNEIDCRDKIIAKLSHFVSKSAFDIDGLGEKQLERFYDLKLVTNYCDIFDLYKHGDKIMNLDNFGEKSYHNLLQSIESNKNIEFSSFLYALNIKHVGENTAKVISQIYKNLDSLIADKETNFLNLQNADGIGEKIIKSMCFYFNNPDNIALLQELNKKINITEDVVSRFIRSKYHGKTIVFTGNLKGITRNEVKALCEKHGLKVLSAVSRKTDFLVVGDKGGGKLKNALEFGVRVLNEEEFNEIFLFGDFKDSKEPDLNFE